MGPHGAPGGAGGGRGGAGGKNLVRNPGFEDGIKPWSGSKPMGTFSFTADRERAFEGEASGRIAIRAPDPEKKYQDKFGAWGRFQQKVSGFETGRKYRVALAYRTSEDFDGQVMVWMITGKSRANLQGKPAGGEWRTFANEWVPVADSGMLYLNLAANQGTVWFDQVSVSAVE